MLKSPSLIAATTCVALAVVLSTPVGAAPSANRAWVSGHGVDQAGCGAPTSPCRTFQYAHDNIVAGGGEIDVLDPAGYGPITIAKAISIVNDGVGTAGVQQGASGQNAITINAGASDAVTLRGLTIDGLGTGQNGVVSNSGGVLTIVDCVIRHFSSDGVLIQPTSGSMSFLISSSNVSDNTGGVDFFPTSGAPNAKGTMDHVVVANNARGVQFDVETSGASLNAAITNSVASNNLEGVSITAALGGQVVASIDNSSVIGNGGSGNTGAGILAAGTPTVRLGRSVIASNTSGIYN